MITPRHSVRAPYSANSCVGLQWPPEENGADVRDRRILFAAFLNQSEDAEGGCAFGLSRPGGLLYLSSASTAGRIVTQRRTASTSAAMSPTMSSPSAAM